MKIKIGYNSLECDETPDFQIRMVREFADAVLRTERKDKNAETDASKIFIEAGPDENLDEICPNCIHSSLDVITSAFVCEKYRKAHNGEYMHCSIVRESQCHGKQFLLPVPPVAEGTTVPTDVIGDTIVFYTDEDFAKDDDTLACTAAFETMGYGDNESYAWSVRVTSDGIPAINEDTRGTHSKNFDTQEELVEFMKGFGFKPV